MKKKKREGVEYTNLLKRLFFLFIIIIMVGCIINFVIKYIFNLFNVFFFFDFVFIFLNFKNSFERVIKFFKFLFSSKKIEIEEDYTKWQKEFCMVYDDIMKQYPITKDGVGLLNEHFDYYFKYYFGTKAFANQFKDSHFKGNWYKKDSWNNEEQKEVKIYLMIMQYLFQGMRKNNLGNNYIPVLIENFDFYLRFINLKVNFEFGSKQVCSFNLLDLFAKMESEELEKFIRNSGNYRVNLKTREKIIVDESFKNDREFGFRSYITHKSLFIYLNFIKNNNFDFLLTEMTCSNNADLLRIKKGAIFLTKLNLNNLWRYNLYMKKIEEDFASYNLDNKTRKCMQLIAKIFFGNKFNFDGLVQKVCLDSKELKILQKDKSSLKLKIKDFIN